MLVVILVIL
jgi:hypothetical protein